ncbi:MAG: ATP-binding protein [Zetaproteobacteria bacterium]|nr:ATP-binding protein [Zetaproteobacteria bacterium]
MQRIELLLRNDLSELSRIAQAVEAMADVCGLGMKQSFHLNLVLDELVTNLVHYAYPEGSTHHIHLTLECVDTTIRCELRDQGIAFNPLDQAEPDLESALEDRAIGGLGIYFMQQMMDDLHYERCDNTNILRLGMRITNEL